MRFRGVVVPAGILVTVLVAGLVAGWALRRGRADTPEEVAAGYFAAWRDGDLDAMRRFVADPPAGFAAQHRALSRGLLVNAIRSWRTRTTTSDGPSSCATATGRRSA